MAKHVSQETFDTVVRENMSDFEMTVEEAIADAVEQFEAQGVITADLVKDVRVYAAGTDTVITQPVVAAVAALTDVLAASPVDVAATCHRCRLLSEECDVDLARRCLAGRHDAYPAVMRALAAVTDDADVVTVIAAMTSLCDGQPDLLDDAGVDALTTRLSHPSPVVVAAVGKLISVLCVKHEGNRQSFVERDVIGGLMTALVTHDRTPPTVAAVSAALRGLMRDDDIRVPFGRAHQHAVTIVTQTDALRVIVDLCSGHRDSASVLGSLFSTLAVLAVRNEFCQQIMDYGGVKLLMDALRDKGHHLELACRALTLVKILAGNDVVKAEIVTAGGGGLETILATVRHHELRPGVAEGALAAMAALVLRAPTHASRLIDSDGAEVIVRAMQLHPQAENVQKQACVVIRNTVARSDDLCAAFTSRGVEELIRAALQGGAGDQAVAALRDLGCKVELRELWKGEGKGLAR